MSASERYIEKHINNIYIDTRDNLPSSDEKHDHLKNRPDMMSIYDKPEDQIIRNVKEEVGTFKVYPSIFNGVDDRDKKKWVKDGQIISTKPYFSLLFWPEISSNED